MKRGQPLKKRSRHPAAVARQERLAQAKVEARERWGYTCIVSGCRRPGVHMHHAFKRQPHPELRESRAILFPTCIDHHRFADTPIHWLYWALREAGGECLAAEAGRRPEPTRFEVYEIQRRHRTKSERSHASPIGAAD